MAAQAADPANLTEKRAMKSEKISGYLYVFHQHKPQFAVLYSRCHLLQCSFKYLETKWPHLKHDIKKALIVNVKTNAMNCELKKLRYSFRDSKNQKFACLINKISFKSESANFILQKQLCKHSMVLTNKQEAKHKIFYRQHKA